MSPFIHFILFLILLLNRDDYKESNKLGWFKTETDYCWSVFCWCDEPCYFYYYYRYKLKNDYYVANTVSVCKFSENYDRCYSTLSKTINLRINWKCSSYLEGEASCKVTPSPKLVVVASEHDGKANIQYDVNNSQAEDVAPECECKNWYVSIND